MPNLYDEVLPEGIEVNPVAKPIKQAVREYKKVKDDINRMAREALTAKDKNLFNQLDKLDDYTNKQFQRLDGLKNKFATLATEGSYKGGQDIADGFISAQQTIVTGSGETKELFDLQPHDREKIIERMNEIKSSVLREVTMINEELKSNFDDIIRQGMGRGKSIRITGESGDIGTKLLNRIQSEGLVLRDSLGRKWSPERYVRMYSRTRSREIQTEAIQDRMEDYDLDLVQISAHLDVDGMDICNEYEGNVYSLSGNHPKYPQLDVKPPFHPNCVHVMTPYIEKYHEAMDGREEEVGRATTTPQRNRYVSEEWEKGFNNSEMVQSQIRANADKYGMTVPEYKEKMTKNLRGMVDDATPRIRIRDRNLEQALDDGNFKTLFETGRSGGSPDTIARAQLENKLFQIPKDATTDRPIYGYLQKGDDLIDKRLTVSHYGEVEVTLKNSVKDRMTVTLGDTLGVTNAGQVHGFVPRTVDKIDWKMYNHRIGKGPFDYTDVDDPLKMFNYFETQYHGGLSVDDIASVKFKGNPRPITIRKLEEKGIEYTVVE